FDHYQDFETRAELRPSAWVIPLNPWPAGHLHLVEIPTPSEHNDNVVAQWIAERPNGSLEPLAFSYALHWTGESPGDAQRGRVVATRVASGRSDDAVQYFVDFESDALAEISSRRVLEGVVTIDPPSAAAILDQQVAKNPKTGGWRLVFQVSVREPARLTAFLREGPNVLTERWVEDATPP
ncbi:MAG TPA: glucan biosynthesis protein, partial [Myxococcota bacterium]|nr:glucan biosynthesis protein [Myxococcota bacterium]